MFHVLWKSWLHPINLLKYAASNGRIPLSNIFNGSIPLSDLTRIVLIIGSIALGR